MVRMEEEPLRYSYPLGFMQPDVKIPFFLLNFTKI